MSISYKTEWKVKFSECDMAGIVFYPRYFEMINFVVEEWLEGLNWSFFEMHEKRSEGFPTVSLECEFLSPSRIGDVLDFEMEISAMGDRSVTLSVSSYNKGVTVLKASVVLVYVKLTAPIESIPIPDELRQKMEPYTALNAASAC
jgi:4-hydroxybenzoyl-CoA thioesterase